ncbi:MAG: hypothetical protein V8Q79_08690 [Christensenellales bacterium]
MRRICRRSFPNPKRTLSAYDFFCMSPVFFDQSPRELGELAARLSLPA